jgi:HKD family nuclease
MAPKLSFHGQPLADPHAAGSFLRSAIGDPDATQISVAVAWARFGGLARLADELRAFRARGGSATLIVGIDEGMATRPGLVLALSLFDDVILFHDRGGRTFHPKLYLVEGGSMSRLFVGSSNLTAAGLYFNFEASLQADFALPEDADHAVLADAHRYIDALRNDTAALQIDADSLDSIATDPRWRIASSERRARRSRGEGVIDPDEIDGQTDSTSNQSLFAASSEAETVPPPLSQEASELLGELEPAGGENAAESNATILSAPVLTWSKTLNSTDAQHPPHAASNPTGNLRLSKAGNPIDHLSWFRRELFRDENWVGGVDTRGNPLETATVAVDVVVASSSVGTVDIRIDHAPHREEGQSNVPTVLHWGSTLGPILRATDFTGASVVIERFRPGTFRLTIS